MPSPLTTRWARGRLADYDGATLGVLIVDGDGADAAATTMEFVDDVSADEVTAAGYVRGTLDVIWSQDGEVGGLVVDPEGTPPTFDTDGGTDPAGIWLYDTTGGSDAARRLLIFLPTAEGAGFADWEPDWPTYLARVRVADDELISAVLAAITTIDGGDA